MKVQVAGAQRPSFKYTCPTRAGSSGSPVILADGTVIAVNSHGTLGDVTSSTGQQVLDGSGSAVNSELTGFALGAPGPEARRILEGAIGGSR
jgi:hypothetical protein